MTLRAGRACTRGSALVAGAASLALLLTGCFTTLQPPSGLDAAERDALQRQSLDDIWSAYNLFAYDRPTPEVEEYVGVDDWPGVMADCMNDDGWSDYVASGGGVTSPSGPDAQESIDWYECFARFPIDPQETGYLSAEQREYIYDWYGEWLMPCITAEGYEIGTRPTRDTFVEVPEQWSGWSPYIALEADVPDTAVQALMEKCGTQPKGIYASAP